MVKDPSQLRAVERDDCYGIGPSCSGFGFDVLAFAIREGSVPKPAEVLRINGVFRSKTRATIVIMGCYRWSQDTRDCI
jgi:hypothetical protein